MKKQIYYRVAVDGMTIDAHDNFHDSLTEAKAYFKELLHFPNMAYSIIRTTTEKVCGL